MALKAQIIGAAIVCGLIYFSWDYISLIRMVYIGKSCFNRDGYKSIDSYKTEKEKMKAVTELCNCIRSEQTYLDKLIIKMPEDC